jgi:Putative peptidoglycan binding domain
MEWLILLTVALVVYVFAIRRGGRAALADSVARGGAGGARRATYGYFRRRDLVWQVVAVLAAVIVLWMVFGDDDTSAPDTETAEATPTTETISSPLNVGDRGGDVVVLQERLDAEGLPVTVDGEYGQETADAVMAFQEQEQLTVEGVVGSETGEALGIWAG